MFRQTKESRIERSVERLHSPIDEVRKKSAKELASLGEPHWQEWIKGDPKDFKRLGNCSDRRAFAWLVDALQDRRCRKSAIEGLAILGDERAIDPIVHAMQDRNVRLAGVKALAKLGHPEWLEWIKGDRLDEERLKEADNEQALRVAMAWEQSDKAKERRRREKLAVRAERRKEQRVAKDQAIPRCILGILMIYAAIFLWSYSLAVVVHISQGREPDVFVLPADPRLYVVLLIFSPLILLKGVVLIYRSYREGKRKPRILTCADCGEVTRRPWIRPWQVILAILLFPFGFLAFLAGWRPGRCPKCGNTLAFGRGAKGIMPKAPIKVGRE